MSDKDSNFNNNSEEARNKPNKKSLIPSNRPKFNYYWIYAIMLAVFLGMQFLPSDAEPQKISWAELREKLLKGDVTKIELVNMETAEIFVKPDSASIAGNDKKAKERSQKIPAYYYTIGSVETFEKDIKDTQNETPTGQMVYIEYVKRKNWGGEILGYILPIALLVGLWFLLMRMMNRGSGGGQIFNIGKSKAQLFDKDTRVSVNFKDVAGLEEAKVEIMEVVDFLKNPKKYTELGGKIPKGVLLVGPPGTGKTLLAKAVAGEAQVPFFSLSGSDFVEMFVGVGASRVRDLFKQAKEKSPCIVFIDEIDAIGRARGRNQITGANDERENTLNQLLTEMDGFSTNSGVIILAATNRADILDRALMRAGRFDRQIHVELPDIEERKAIFGVHVKGLKKDGTVDTDFLSRQTPGFSGADIANVCNEAALIAARNGKEAIGKSDFISAIDRIVGGLEKRNKLITIDEKRVIAFHESGHAAVSWLLEHAHPLVKVTIVPRGKALGAAWYLPEERQITTFEQMFDEMTAALAGRASEEVTFGKVSTGALNDLEKVTKQAYNMVVFFGLNEKIGNISFYDSSSQGEYNFQKPYSEHTARIIDEEISKLVEKAYARAKTILKENFESIQALAKVLLEKEVIYREDLESIFGPRPFDGANPALLDRIREDVPEKSASDNVENPNEKPSENEQSSAELPSEETKTE